MQLEIITPESKVFSGEVDAVQLPGLDGLFQVLKGHAPIVSALTKGTVKVDLKQAVDASELTSGMISADTSNSKVIRVSINGGVVELLNDKVIVLAE
jgi:F-type H+-transporting ATPase subunit epsilon